jgi:methyltransferase
MEALPVIVGLVVLQRLAELRLAKANEMWLRSRGGIERGQSHYKYFIGLHAAFFISLTAEAAWRWTPGTGIWWFPLFVFAVAQALRVWCIVSLGRFWNTKIIVVPGSSPVRRGPYRFLRHPNYLVVTVELAALPLVFHAYATAVLFSALNALLVAHRIREEEAALRAFTSYSKAMAGHVPCFFPFLPRRNR